MSDCRLKCSNIKLVAILYLKVSSYTFNRRCVQAGSKFIQIQQSPAKPKQNKSKKKALISLDSLGGFEPFQWLAATPWGKKIFRLHLGSPEAWRSRRFHNTVDPPVLSADISNPEYRYFRISAIDSFYRLTEWQYKIKDCRQKLMFTLSWAVKS
jgi:hypothetical protein